MKTNWLAALGVCLMTLVAVDFAAAQRGGRGGGPGGGFGGGASSWIGLLRMDSVQNEIELVDDQQEEIQQLQEEMWQEMQNRMSEVRGLEPEERRERFGQLREEMESKQAEYQERIEGVLLPMQVKRLKELQIQSQSRRSGEGAIGVLQNDEVLEELGIDEEQREKLEAKAKEVREKLTEKVRKLQAEAEEEILSVLSSEQRKKLRDKIGETFEFGNDRPNFGRRDDGGRNDGRRGREEDKSEDSRGSR